MTRNFIRPIFHKEDNPAHLTREDRREKDAAVAARHRAEGGTRYWCYSKFHLKLKISMKEEKSRGG